MAGRPSCWTIARSPIRSASSTSRPARTFARPDDAVRQDAPALAVVPRPRARVCPSAAARPRTAPTPPARRPRRGRRRCAGRRRRRRRSSPRQPVRTRAGHPDPGARGRARRRRRRPTISSHVPVRRARSSSTSRRAEDVSSRSAQRAATPVACGTAMLVPLMSRTPPPGAADGMSTPGATSGRARVGEVRDREGARVGPSHRADRDEAIRRRRRRGRDRVRPVGVAAALVAGGRDHQRGPVGRPSRGHELGELPELPQVVAVALERPRRRGLRLHALVDEPCDETGEVESERDGHDVGLRTPAPTTSPSTASRSTRRRR